MIGTHAMVKSTAYLFIAQFLIFGAYVALLIDTTALNMPSDTIVWADFLIELEQNTTTFFMSKVALLTLRTCYGLCFVGMAVIYWTKNTVAAPFLASFILVSVAIINVSQLMAMALIPLANAYGMAVTRGESIRIAVIESTAQGIYTVHEYLDIFVNTVTFVGLFVCLLVIFNKEHGLRRIKWLIPVMMLIPYNRVLTLPGILNLVAGLTNIVVTAAFFLLMGRYLLRAEQVPE